MESGDDVWFETATTGIRCDHLLAATALVPLFPPVEIELRTLCDAGLSNNLPLDRVLRADLPRRTLCIASDLFALEQAAPGSIDQAVTRVQDLAFAIQSRKALSSLLRERSLLHRLDPARPTLVLGLLSRSGAPYERALKALDFSRVTLAEGARHDRPAE